MNNIEWTALLDKIPPELRAGVVQHAIEAQTSVMAASNALLERMEGKLDQAIASWQADTNDRKQIAIGLDLIITEIGKLSGEVTKLRGDVATLQRGQQRGDKERKAMQRRLSKIEKDLQALQQEVTALKARA